MDEAEIWRLERLAADTWYDAGEEVKLGDILSEHGEPEKIYRYGRYGDVEVWKYDDFVIVIYLPTNTARLFKDKDQGFQFARDRATHVGAIEKLLR